jgi:hypothetical protein
MVTHLLNEPQALTRAKTNVHQVLHLNGSPKGDEVAHRARALV